MIIIGVDFHPEFQQIAAVDMQTVVVRKIIKRTPKPRADLADV